MSISQQALWFVCGIGAVVFSAGVPSWRRIAASALGFVLSFLLLRNGGIPDAPTLAGFVLLFSACKLYRYDWKYLTAITGGLLAAALGSLLVAQGLPPVAAWPLAATLPALTLALSRDPRFAPEPTVEEGVLLMLALSLGAAAGPAILDGWQSAGALNAVSGEAARALPVWVLLAAAASIGMGGLWSAWRHR